MPNNITAVRYGEIFHLPSAREISRADSCNKSYIMCHHGGGGGGGDYPPISMHGI